MKVCYIGLPNQVEASYKHTSEHVFDALGRNTGNLAFVYAISRHMTCEVDLFGWNFSPDQVRGKYDAVVFACANQLGPHSDLGWLGDRLDKLDMPILAIGLGAQAPSYDKDVSLTAGTKRWLSVIAAHSPGSAPNIGVRGEYSRRQVELQGFGGNAVVMGCPSNFINCDPELPGLIKKRLGRNRIDRIAVPAGLHLWYKLRTIEQQLAGLVEETKGLYIAQSELGMIRLSRGEFDKIGPADLALLNDYIRPDLSAEDFEIWCKRYATCYVDATSWLEAMRTVDFVVGPRFHGVMFAMQTGTPGGVVAHDSRTQEMCETMCIPFRHFSTLTEPLKLESVRSLFEFDADTYASRRIELAKNYVSILQGANITVPDSLVSLAAAS